MKHRNRAYPRPFYNCGATVWFVTVSKTGHAEAVRGKVKSICGRIAKVDWIPPTDPKVRTPRTSIDVDYLRDSALEACDCVVYGETPVDLATKADLKHRLLGDVNATFADSHLEISE